MGKRAAEFIEQVGTHPAAIERDDNMTRELARIHWLIEYPLPRSIDLPEELFGVEVELSDDDNTDDDQG